MPSFELLDVIQHAYPSIAAIDVVRTAQKLKKAGGSINNYNMAIEHIPAYCSGHQKPSDLIAYLRTHPNQRWQKHLEDVGTRLLEIFDGEPSKWYHTGRKPIESIAGLRVKPAIRGVWVSSGKAFPCLINPRSTVLLEKRFNLPFAARGVHELHVRDEVNVAGPMIIDLGKDPATDLRANRVYYPTETEMMSVEQFEDVLRKFNEALALAGFQPKAVASAIDLFRTR
jgi:hypothetical protein